MGDVTILVNDDEFPELSERAEVFIQAYREAAEELGTEDVVVLADSESGATLGHSRLALLDDASLPEVLKARIQAPADGGLAAFWLFFQKDARVHVYMMRHRLMGRGGDA